MPEDGNQYSVGGTAHTQLKQTKSCMRACINQPTSLSVNELTDG